MTDATEPASQPDPFDGHLRFVAYFEAKKASTFADRMTLTPLEPIDVSVDRKLDFESLEAIASWHGFFKNPRIKDSAEFDVEADNRLKECMAQFHLRNIGRVERIADPDEPLEYGHSRVPYGLRADGAEIPKSDFECFAGFLSELTYDVVKSRQVMMRWFRHETQWEKHVCRELKEATALPLWRYHADADEDDGA